MLLSSNGIVLHSHKYGDRAIISKVFSEEKGLITLIANRTKSRKNNQNTFFSPFCAIHFVCYLSNKSDIYRVKELCFNPSVPQPSDDVILSSIRFFLAEFITKVVKEEEQNSSL